MQTIRRLLLLAPLAIALGAGAGCAGNETREYAKVLDPLIGRADKAYMIERYGEPDKRTRVDAHTDIWEFRTSDVPLSAYGSRGNTAVSTLLRVTFTDDRMSAWQAFNTIR